MLYNLAAERAALSEACPKSGDSAKMEYKLEIIC